MKKSQTDKEFLERVKQIAPEVLDAEVDFDEKIIRALPSKRERNKSVIVTTKPNRIKSKKK